MQQFNPNREKAMISRPLQDCRQGDQSDHKAPVPSVQPMMERVRSGREVRREAMGLGIGLHKTDGIATIPILLGIEGPFDSEGSREREATALDPTTPSEKRDGPGSDEGLSGAFTNRRLAGR
jgi:hypothetical protein